MELELRGITKRFGPLVANDGISLSVAPGQIHALLGENGAGKSTLMNVLYGLTQPDEGEILIDGKPVSFGSPKDAIAAGIGMVHQHFMLVPVFTVAENVTLGIERDPARSACLDRRKPAREVADLSHRYGLDVDPDALVEDLPGRHPAAGRDHQGAGPAGERADPRRADGGAHPGGDRGAVPHHPPAPGTAARSIIFISHKLREVQAIADTITVMRRGKVVGQRTPTATEDDLAALMVGRDVQLRVSKDPARPGDGGARVADLTVADDRRPGPVDGLSLRGAGRGDPRHRRRAGQRADRAVRGADGAAADRGRLGHAGRARPHPRVAAGAAAGRHRLRARGPPDDGLVGPFSVAENLVLDMYDRPPFASGINLNLAAIRANATERIAEFDVRTGRRAPPRARCPAATSRRSSWPGRSAASTSC